MKKLLSVAAVALLALTASANAATLNITLGFGPSYSDTGVALSPNIDLQTFGGLSLTGNAFVIAPPTSVTDQYLAPNGGSVFANSYLAVLAQGPGGVPAAGQATFVPAVNMNEFSFTWGSVDSYNTLTITDSAANVFVFTGTDILNHIVGGVEHVTDKDVRFIDPFGSIISAVFSSTVNAFEAANFGQAETPVPASVILFATALAGLFWLARARQRKAI